MDVPGSRSSVQFKPSKKMKKRRQLDALVGNEKKLPRRKHSRDSGHELLRSNDSGSSDGDESSDWQRQKWEKRLTGSGCCFTCYTMTCALLVTSCLLACAALVWMHLELKRDFNHLRNRLELVEDKNAGTPEEFQALQLKLNLLNKSLIDMKTGKYGLDSLNKSIADMHKQIASLSAVQQQQKKQKSDSDNNNNDASDIHQTVADLGSGLGSLQAEVETLKSGQKTLTSQLEDLSDRVSTLEKPGGREGGLSAANTEGLQVKMSLINSSLTESLTKAASQLDKHQTHIEALDQFTQGLQEQVRRINVQTTNLTQSFHHLQDSWSDPGHTVTQLQGQLTQLQQAVQQMQSDIGNETRSPMLTNTSSPAAVNQLHALLKDHEDLAHFRREVFQDITSLNASVGSMSVRVNVVEKDVGNLSSQMNAAIIDISNLTSIVRDINNFLHLQDTDTAPKKEDNELKDIEAKSKDGATSTRSSTGVTDSTSTSPPPPSDQPSNHS